MISFSRHDCIRNEHRRYALWVQPTLFGGYSLMAQWGRTDNLGGQTSRVDFSDGDHAAMALNKAIMKRVARGYAYRPITDSRSARAPAMHPGAASP